MLGDDFVLAILNRAPIDLHALDVLDAVFLGSLEMVVKFGIEQQALGGDAANVEASAAQLGIFFDEGSP